MRVRTRLLLTLAAVLLLASLPGWFAVARVGAVRDIAVDLGARQAGATIALGRYQTALAEIDHAQRAFAIIQDDAAAARVRAALGDAGRQLAALDSAGYAEVAAPARETLAALAAVGRRLEALIAAGHPGQATDFLAEMRPLHERAARQLDELSAAVDRAGAERAGAAERIAASTARWGIVALLLGMLGAAAVGLHAADDLAGALRRLRAAHARVGANEDVAHSPDLPDERPDEIGDLARSFRAMTHQLGELDRAKAEFVSMASHEIKAPAGMIASYAELLEEALVGLEARGRGSVAVRERARAEASELLEAIRGQAAALSRQVQQLLELTRLEAGGFELRVEEVDACDFLESVALAYRPLARAAELEMEVAVEPSLPPRVRVDPEALRIDVLGNLLGNAIKFSSPGGRVRLEAWGERDTLHLSVSDTAVGIPEEQLPYVFEKYYQAGKHAGKVGSGLGLAIARMVVEAHAGTIGVESELGKGTRFHVVLPGAGVYGRAGAA